MSVCVCVCVQYSSSPKRVMVCAAEVEPPIAADVPVDLCRREACGARDPVSLSLLEQCEPEGPATPHMPHSFDAATSTIQRAVMTRVSGYVSSGFKPYVRVGRTASAFVSFAR